MDLDVYLKNFCAGDASSLRRAVIVGLGPAAGKCDNLDFDGKYVVTLNSSWTLLHSDACITIHPLETFKDCNQDSLEYIPKLLLVGREKWKAARHMLGKMNPAVYEHIKRNVTVVEFTYRLSNDRSLPHESQRFGRHPQFISRRRGNFLYVWTSISQTAMHFLYRCGFQTIELVGCDATSFRAPKDNLIHLKQTRWNGVPSSYRLSTYAHGNLEVATILRSLGLKIYTIFPSVTLNESFVAKELFNGSAPFRPNSDISRLKPKILGFVSFWTSRLFGERFALKIYLKLGKTLFNIKRKLKQSAILRSLYSNLYYYYIKYWRLADGAGLLTPYGNYYLPFGINLNNSSVISLGVGNDLSFEKALLDGFQQVEIHIADPTPEVVAEVNARQGHNEKPNATSTRFRWKPNTLPYIDSILSRVHFHPYGVSDRQESLVFYRKANGLNASAVPLSNSSPSLKVEMLDILQFCSMTKLPLALLKLDIEGYAPRVISRILACTEYRPVIVGEFEIFSIGDSVAMIREVADVVKKLEAEKYKVYRTINNRKKTIEFACIPV